MNPDEELSVKEFAEKYVGYTVEQYGRKGRIVGYGTHGVLVDREDKEGWKVYSKERYTFLTSIDEETALWAMFLNDPYQLSPPKSNEIEVVNKEESLLPILADYLSRFKDIDRIIVNDNATIVILKSKEKGIAKPCPGENRDIRVGILEAYVKALKLKHKPYVLSGGAIFSLGSTSTGYITINK